MTIRDLAHHLDVGWDTIKDIQKRDLARRYAKPELKHLRAIAIEEIAVARGRRSLTVLLDLDSGAVVFVGDGTGAGALKPFRKRLLARMYVRAKDLPGIHPRHRPEFRTKLALGVELLRWARSWLRYTGKPLWVAVDGAYAKSPFLKPTMALGMRAPSPKGREGERR
jgi:hypothetical protein